MSEMTVLRDENGDYYVLSPDVMAAAQTAGGTYELAADALAAARVPAEDRPAVEAAVGEG